jgi:hypothetical protein
MLSKQAHVIKKWLELNPQYKPLWSKLDKNTFLLIHERILRTLIYSTWNNDWYQADKPVLDWHNEFANSFFKQFENTKALRGWQNGIEYLKKEASNFIEPPTNNGLIDSLTPFGKHYKIGKMK